LFLAFFVINLILYLKIWEEMSRIVWKNYFIIIGPILGLITWLIFPDTPDVPLAAPTAAVAVWMGFWWLTEAIPLAVTSLLPLVLFPLLGVIPAKVVAGAYTNDVVFLFIGGFIVALAMERWNLHKRLALRIIIASGGGTKNTVLGFMLATSFLSMWISNTATAMMMMPMAMAVLSKYDTLLDEVQAKKFSLALLLGIAHAASVGGIATLVGTPPNLVFTAQFQTYFPEGPEISFAQWMQFALPITIALFVMVFLVLNFKYLRKIKTTESKSIFKDELKSLGKMSFEEKSIMWVFVALVVLWITRKPIDLNLFVIPGWTLFFPEPGYIGDGTISIALAILLFILPAKREDSRLMNWETAKKIPWNIVLLFGGGFALAAAIKTSGLAGWIGFQMQDLSVLSPTIITGIICSFMTFITELTSNTATTQMILPILASVAVSMGRNPLYLMIPATISASCAFMMPVATPPNAIVFGTGRIRIIDMAKTGLILNIFGIIIITFMLVVFGSVLFGSAPDVLPEWANTLSASNNLP
jgi:solute carrier family 13 (sodium-dependent dicarboxylate transporter), member 2/3/5